MSRYKAYPEYKESSVDWLGAIPLHWVSVPLKRICTLKTGLTPPTDNEANYSDEESLFNWIRPEDLNEQGDATIGSKYLSESGWNLMRKIPPQSTLICCIGTIGKIGFVNNTVATNQQITAAIFERSKRFNFYLINASRNILEESATGNVIKILNSERLGNINIVSVPPDEAEKIAAFLDHETAKIDALIEKQQRLIELLKEKRQAVISHAVTKGLNPNAPMKDSGVEWLGEVPAHWAVSQIRRLVQVRGGFAFNSDLFSEEGIPVIRIGDINNDGRISLDACKRIYAVDRGYLQYAVRRGDLLMAMTGATIGKAGWYLSDELAYLNQRVGIFKPLNESLLMTYLWYILNSAGYQAYIKLTAFGGAQPNISDTGMVAYYSATPSLSEQGKIVAYLDVVTKKLDDLCRKAESQISLMQERRTALISAAVTGKIDVRDWQPAAVQEGVGVEC